MSSEYKELYGEVETPLFFVEKMFEMIPKEIFKNKDLKWLDVGCGTGIFSMYLYHVLFKSLEDVIINPETRRRHIIENMIYMVEINEIYEIDIVFYFGNRVNLYIRDFLQHLELPKIDIIIGNPPFNRNSINENEEGEINENEEGEINENKEEFSDDDSTVTAAFNEVEEKVNKMKEMIIMTRMNLQKLEDCYTQLANCLGMEATI